MTTRVGIVGYSCATGLGSTTRDFYAHLPFSRWLVIAHGKLGVERAWLDSNCQTFDENGGLQAVEEWLDGLDVVFSIERSYIGGLWLLAKSKGIRVCLMPNAEWLRPDAPTLKLVDTFIAPTLACAQMLHEWGFGARTEYIPHVIDTERFGYRKRDRAGAFVHCRGWGGYEERKGTGIVLEAARRCPKVKFLVYYQEPFKADWPSNVELIGATAQAEEQYSVGDVAIQPSRWEGVGLQILEAMSCGLPTIVPDAAPMNEYPVSEALCMAATPRPINLGHKMWTAWETDIDSLVRAIRCLLGRPIEDLSRRSRAKMMERSWNRLRPEYLRVLGMSDNNSL